MFLRAHHGHALAEAPCDFPLKRSLMPGTQIFQDLQSLAVTDLGLGGYAFHHGHVFGDRIITQTDQLAFAKKDLKRHEPVLIRVTGRCLYGIIQKVRKQTHENARIQPDFFRNRRMDLTFDALFFCLCVIKKQ